MKLEELEKQLVHACDKDGNIEEVQELLQNPKINPNCQSGGWTPLNIACFHGDIEIVKLLLNDKRVEINKALEDGWTPFYYACKYNRIDIVKLLLDDKRIADINKANKNGVTPFYIACQEGNSEVVKLLLNDERISLKKVPYDGITAIDITKERNIVKLIKEFDTGNLAY